MLKPVVFIPGFPASELYQKSKKRTIFPPGTSKLLSASEKAKLIDLLTPPDQPEGDIVAGEPIREVLSVAKQAQSLYDILRAEYGYTIHRGDNFRAVGWDWRKAIDDVAVQADIGSAIDELAAAAGGKVVVLVHSTGGLVFRRLIEQKPAVLGNVEQILAFGVPWAGNLKALRYLVRGESFGFLFLKLNARQVRTIMTHAQAAYDLVPPDPAQTVMKDADGNELRLVAERSTGQQLAPLLDPRILPSGDAWQHVAGLAGKAHQRLGRRTAAIVIPGVVVPPLTNVVGWGAATETACWVERDGKVTFEVGKAGDGTVATSSGAWLRGPNVSTFYMPIGLYPTVRIPSRHSRVWDAPPTRQIFDTVLASRAPQNFVCAAVDSDESIDRRSDVTVRVSAQDSAGGPLPDAALEFNLNGKIKRFSFLGYPRLDLVVKRSAVTPNAVGRFFRIVLHVSWAGGGAQEVPVLIDV